MSTVYSDASEMSIYRLVLGHGIFRETRGYPASLALDFSGGLAFRLPKIYAYFASLGHLESTLRLANIKRLDREVAKLLRMKGILT